MHIPRFELQIQLPGTTFLDAFSSIEIADAKRTPLFAQSLAGKWAAKEAFIKAWSLSLLGKPLPILDIHAKMHQIEVQKDVFYRPHLRLGRTVKSAFEKSLPDAHLSISISHDADYATAICTLTA